MLIFEILKHTVSGILSERHYDKYNNEDKINRAC
jgi:hypothetical protein